MVFEALNDEVLCFSPAARTSKSSQIENNSFPLKQFRLTVYWFMIMTKNFSNIYRGNFETAQSRFYNSLDSLNVEVFSDVTACLTDRI